jgi:hypothetical protein
MDTAMTGKEIEKLAQLAQGVSESPFIDRFPEREHRALFV